MPTAKNDVFNGLQLESFYLVGMGVGGGGDLTFGGEGIEI